jgi:hypothetical protein
MWRSAEEGARSGADEASRPAPRRHVRPHCGGDDTGGVVPNSAGSRTAVAVRGEPHEAQGGDAHGV